MKPKDISRMAWRAICFPIRKLRIWLPWRPRVDFITIHYMYIMGWTIFGSILIFPTKNLAYADCLFFSSGAATQSGLNSVDFNLLNTYQQIVLMFIPWFCNPITINTATVYVRLYWFGKRFEAIVEQSRSAAMERRTLSRSRRKSEGELDMVERGVGGRKITVLHDSGRRTGGPSHPVEKPDENAEKIPELEKFRRSVANGATGPDRPIQFSNGHSRSRSDANHRLAMRQSVPGLLMYDENNEIAVEDEDDTGHGHSNGHASKADDTEIPHITFAEPKKKPKRKDSEVFVVPSAFDVETRGSVAMPRMQNHGEAEEEDDEDEDRSPLASPTFAVNRAISFDESKLHREPPAPGIPRQRMRAATTKESHAPSTQGITRVISDAFGRHRRNSDASKKSGKSGKTVDKLPYLSYMPTIGRNSQFHFSELTDEQKDELGGIEYRSLVLLGYILWGYFLFFQVFGVLCLLPWIWRKPNYGSIITSDGQGRSWWAIFTASSAFTDLGFTLTPDSMVSFNTATWPLLVMSYLIIIGNTGFPCMLRFIIWALWKLCPKNWIQKESLHFLLDHPRRCFTLLFPSNATWWLFAILVGLNFTDVILFIVLDLNNETITSLATSTRVLNAYFQAVSTRTAGFGIVNLAALHPAVQVSYMIMMYISVFPIAISVRRTNVYEERSLGIYGSHNDETEENEPSFVGAHLRKQLSFDLWYIFLGLFCICVAEGSRISNRNDYAFTQFSCLFEVVSAYGTVGLSLGYPNTNASFSAQFSTFSKIVIMAMMIRGRHRGLPYELDRAILLPSESLQQKEEEDANLRLQRRANTFERRSISGPVSRPATQEREHNGNANNNRNSGISQGSGIFENSHYRMD